MEPITIHNQKWNRKLLLHMEWYQTMQVAKQDKKPLNYYEG
jgi:hypothetical protein